MKKQISILIFLAVFVLSACASPQVQVIEPVGENDLTTSAEKKIVVEARVVPSQWTSLSFQTGAAVLNVNTQEGDTVEVGEVLIQLDDSDARYAVEMAEAALELAKAQLALATAKPDRSRIADAEHAIVEAEAGVRASKAQLDKLPSWADKNDVAAAEAALDAAEARHERAKNQLNWIKTGTSAEEIGVVKASVEQAEVALRMAEAQLAKYQVVANTSGTVIAINVKPGQFAAPGAPAVTLADLSTWQIETDDLSELDIVDVGMGDTALLTFDAIPGLQMTGKISQIKAMGENRRGEVVYTVLLQPERQDKRLLWNMTTQVVLTPR